MAYKFNPLIKECLQLDNGGGGGDTQQKVTKCTTADELDAVADGEIFEWQGVETIVNGTTLENGYFYKKAAGSTYTIPAGSLYFDVISDIITDLFTIPAGRYYQLELVNLHVYGVAQNSVNGVKCSWFTNYDDTPDHVGNYVVFKNGEVTTIATLGMSGYANTDNKGNALYNATRNNFGEKNIYTFVSEAGYLADIVLVFGDDTASTYLIGKVVNNQMCAGDNNYFNGAYYSGGKLTEDYTVDTSTYTRIDTQPPTPGITEENGTLKVSFPVQFEDDVTVKGTQTVVHTEEIESEHDYIELRADNPLGLASGEMSGIEVNNYDGNGTDCILAVDKDGWARVGDKNGTLEKLATIEESPADGLFVQYDATAKQLKTAAIPEATTTAAGLMSAADKSKVNTIGIVYRGQLQHNLQVMQNGSNLIHVHCQDFNSSSCCLDCYVAARGTTGSVDTFTWHYAFILFDQTKLDIVCNLNGVINVINNTGRPDSDFILFIDKLI